MLVCMSKMLVHSKSSHRLFKARAIRPLVKTDFERKQRFNIDKSQLCNSEKEGGGGVEGEGEVKEKSTCTQTVHTQLISSPNMLQTSCRDKAPSSMTRYKSELVVKAASFQQCIALRTVLSKEKQGRDQGRDQGQKELKMSNQAETGPQAQEKEKKEEEEEQKTARSEEKTVLAACQQAFEPDIIDYVLDIHQSWLESEKHSIVPSNFMDFLTQINVRMRSILVDWLWDVAARFKLLPETMGLTIQLIDRYLHVRGASVPRAKLQLLGVVCMLIASKYEEIYFPELNDFVYITDKAYSKRQILSMETVVLNGLNFEFSLPTTVRFILVYCQEAAPDCWHIVSNAYIVFKIVSINHRFSSIEPSKIAFAATALGIAWKNLGEQNVTGKNRAMFQPCEGQHLKAVSGRSAVNNIGRVETPNSRLKRLETFAQMKRNSESVKMVQDHVMSYLTGKSYSGLTAPGRGVQWEYRNREGLIAALKQLGFDTSE